MIADGQPFPVAITERHRFSKMGETPAVDVAAAAVLWIGATDVLVATAATAVFATGLRPAPVPNGAVIGAGPLGATASAGAFGEGVGAALSDVTTVYGMTGCARWPISATPTDNAARMATASIICVLISIEPRHTRDQNVSPGGR